MQRPAESRTLGDALRIRRLELGWSQESVAARVVDLGGDLRQSDVSRLERGKVGLPRRDRLERIAAVLELSMGDLLARSGWAGAGAAFDRLDEQMPAPDEHRPIFPAAVPAAHPTVVPRVPNQTLLSPRLRLAIDHAHGLEAWSVDVLRRAANTLEHANRSMGRQVAAAAPRSMERDDRRTPRGR